MPTVENTGTYIKRYNFWNPATWTIPSLYWDTFSQEQRVHAICRQLSKVIQYVDYLGVNTDDVVARLKAIEDGQLDEFIVSAIEDWFNENQPAIIDAIEALQTQTADLESILPSSEFTSENTVKDAIDDLQTDTQDKIDIINGSIDSINDDIDAIESIIPSSDFSALSTVKDAIDTLAANTQDAIGDLADIIPSSEFSAESTVKDAIDQIGAQIGNIVNKAATVILIGDSYVNDNDASKATIGKSLISKMTDWNIYNAADAGAGWRGGGVNGRNYKAQFVYAKNNFADFYDTDAILIIGSRNEAGGLYAPHPPYGDLPSVVADCLDEMQSTLPNAKIYIFPDLWDWIMPNSNIKEVSIVIQTEAYKRNIFCARGCWTWGTGQESTLYVGGNDIHPNSVGCDLFANYIINAIGSNNEYCWINRQCTIGSDGGNYHLNIWTQEDTINMQGAWVQNAEGQGTNRICNLATLPEWIRFKDRSGNTPVFQIGYGYAAASSNEMLAILYSTNGLSIGRGTTVLTDGFTVSIGSSQTVFYTQ